MAFRGHPSLLVLGQQNINSISNSDDFFFRYVNFLTHKRLVTLKYNSVSKVLYKEISWLHDSRFMIPLNSMFNYEKGTKYSTLSGCILSALSMSNDPVGIPTLVHQHYFPYQLKI